MSASSPPTPDGPQGPPGVSVAPPSTAPPWTRFLSRPWFWVLVIGAFWLLPMLKSLDAEMPEAPPGVERMPERIELTDMEGRDLRLGDLEGFLKVVLPLRMADPAQAEKDFLEFRKLKKHLRSMGTITVYLLMVEGSEPAQLSAFLDKMKGRKPNNVYLLDGDGAVFRRLVESGGQDTAVTFLLDRHGRLRGSYGLAEQDQRVLFMSMALLGNWGGSDPELGQPVYH